jgi:hypothetical protein
MASRYNQNDSDSDMDIDDGDNYEEEEEEEEGEEEDDSHNRVPCEICDDMVLFDEYADHLERCIMGGTHVESAVIRTDTFILPSTEFPTQIPSFLRNISLERGLVPTDAFALVGARLIQYMQNGNEYEYNLLMQELMGGAVNSGIVDINAVIPLYTETVPPDTLCSICCETIPFKDAETGVERAVRKTKCNHFYCDPCISKWVEASKRCPNCIANLE